MQTCSRTDKDVRNCMQQRCFGVAETRPFPMYKDVHRKSRTRTYIFGRGWRWCKTADKMGITPLTPFEPGVLIRFI